MTSNPSNTPKPAQLVFDIDLITTFATGFGLGLSPILPGTAGALPGLLIAVFLSRWTLRSQILALLALIALAVVICDHAEHQLGIADDPRIVADEFLTFPIATLGLPCASNPGLLGAAFLASRILDGVKPPPAASAEGLPGGAGVVLDDVIANLYVLLLLTFWRRTRRPRQ